MCTICIKLVVAIVAVVFLRNVIGNEVLPDCPDDQRIIFTAQPTDMEVIWGANNTVDFPCQYDGSTSIPQWIINSTVFGSLNSRLPADHYYHDHTLSVRNIKLWQNETTYQCQIVTINGPSLCAYRSTIGHLIIRCNATVVPTSTIKGSKSETAFRLYSSSDMEFGIIITSLFYPSLLKSSSYYETVTSLSEFTHSNTMSKPVLIGAITISTVCSMIIAVLIAIPLGLWCHKRNKSGKLCLILRRNNTENDYDEPSLPSPIYQEINEINIMAPQQEMPIEMMTNYSYATVRSKGSTIILRECPAYARQSDMTL